MKFVRRWQWENTWLAYSLLAYLLLPAVVAWWTVPDIVAVYAEAGVRSVLIVSALGAGWGLSVVLLGRAVDAVGLAVSNGLILGCSIALGSLTPLLLTSPQTIVTPVGVRLLAVNALILLGVFCCACAAWQRDTFTDDTKPLNAASRPRLRIKGLVICFVAGALAPLINLALASGERITVAAEVHGAASTSANNAVWGLTLCSGALPGLILCALQLSQNGTWNRFRGRGSSANGSLCLLMATVFFVSTVAYGVGATRLGTMGPAFGWPVYMSCIIVGNSAWGSLTGEWRGASAKIKAIMLMGIVCQVTGILSLFLVSQSNNQ